ncbi:MAG: hypothetical protein RIA63_02235 [Cyclobacteriaceae bacterium]
MIETPQQSTIEAWFDNLIATLRAHQIQLETDTANSEQKKFYEAIFAGNADEVAHLGKRGAQQHFVSRIIIDYVKIIADAKPLKLAFDYDDSEVLVWAEINNGDLEQEKNLLRAEAIINSKYHGFGFDMETTIVEAGDRLLIPNHYKLFKS